MSRRSELKRAQAHQGKNLDFLYALCKTQVGGGGPTGALIDDAITQYKLSSELPTWGKETIEKTESYFSVNNVAIQCTTTNFELKV